MKHRKIMIWLLTAAFLLLAMVVGYVSLSQREVVLPLRLQVDGAEVQQPWRKTREEYVFFLPGYAEEVRVAADVPGTLTVDGIVLEDGMSWDCLQTDTPLEVLWKRGLREHRFTVTVVRSGKLPALYLDVKSGSMDYIHQERNNKESGSLRLYAEEGALLLSCDMASLESRGNSTINRSKKPYNVVLTGEADLLGMGAAKRWVLLADSYDSSHLRNKTVLDIAREFGLTNSSESRWVDLYLNGEYVGLYTLCERVEVHPRRVDLTEEGSFLISVERKIRLDEKQQRYVTTRDNASLRIHMSDLEDARLLAQLQTLENALLAEDGRDPETGTHWSELIDLDSWVRKYILEEAFSNTDSPSLSQYFYRDGYGKVFSGPAWDYDLAIGNRNGFPGSMPNMMYTMRENVYGARWYEKICRDPLFRQRMQALYEGEFRPLLQRYLEEVIPAYAETVAASAQADSFRWSNRWSSLNPPEETDYLLDFMARRMEFLDSFWLRGDEYVTVLVRLDTGVVHHYCIRPGDPMTPLPEYEDTPQTDYQGWYVSGTDQPLDPDRPIWEDMEIYLKFVSLPPEEVVVEESGTFLRYAPVVLLVLGLLGLGLWDRTRWQRPARRQKVFR